MMRIFLISLAIGLALLVVFGRRGNAAAAIASARAEFEKDKGGH